MRKKYYFSRFCSDKTFLSLKNKVLAESFYYIVSHSISDILPPHLLENSTFVTLESRCLYLRNESFPNEPLSVSLHEKQL